MTDHGPKTGQFRKILPRLVVLAVVVAIFAGGWYLDSQREKQRSVLSGVFESEPSELSSRVEGRVARIDVLEGDSVTAGQPLIVLDSAPDQLSAQADEAKAAQSRQALQEALDGPTVNEIDKAREAVAEQSAELLRLRNGPLPQEVRQAQGKLAEAQANYRKVIDGPRPDDIRQARQAADAALARLTEAKNGPTIEDVAQAKARLDSASAAEAVAASEAARADKLFAEDAITRQDRDRAAAAYAEATARRAELAQAYRQAVTGTRPEEIAAAQHQYEQALAALDELLAGSRQEDKDAASAQVAQAQQALSLLLQGSRPEDIAAAQARLAQAQAALADLLAGTRKEQVAQARAAAQSAALSASSAATSVADRIVRAPGAGIVERVLVAAGDLVRPGQSLVRLDDPSDIWLRVYVPESRLSQTGVGTDASIKVDGIDTPLSALVESVAAQGDYTPANLQTPDERGKQVFAVRLRLKSSDSRVRPGMNATVTRLGNWAP